MKVKEAASTERVVLATCCTGCAGPLVTIAAPPAPAIVSPQTRPRVTLRHRYERRCWPRRWHNPLASSDKSTARSTPLPDPSTPSRDS